MKHLAAILAVGGLVLTSVSKAQGDEIPGAEAVTIYIMKEVDTEILLKLSGSAAQTAAWKAQLRAGERSSAAKWQAVRAREGCPPTQAEAERTGAPSPKCRKWWSALHKYSRAWLTEHRAHTNAICVSVLEDPKSWLEVEGLEKTIRDSTFGDTLNSCRAVLRQHFYLPDPYSSEVN